MNCARRLGVHWKPLSREISALVDCDIRVRRSPRQTPQYIPITRPYQPLRSYRTKKVKEEQREKEEKVIKGKRVPEAADKPKNERELKEEKVSEEVNKVKKEKKSKVEKEAKNNMAGLKRKADSQPKGADKKSKKVKEEPKNYEDTPSVKDENGDIIWPAPAAEIEMARELIRESAASGKTTLIVPDKDADGLSSGVILHRTLVALGHDPNKIKVHLVSKGNNIHTESERTLMASYSPTYIFVLDQGSRPGPPVIDSSTAKVLIIDHHYAEPHDFPLNSSHVSACHYPPVATSATLTYTICLPLHPSLESSTSWLCALGTMGDLGTTLKFLPPFPSMAPTFKTHPKSHLTKAIALINAPRRTAAYNVLTAWRALLSASAPSDLLPPSAAGKELDLARQSVAAEVERTTHTPPSFSADGKIAVFRISSEAQVHPVVATRWAGYLKSSKLEIVMVANEGYTEGRVHFSCRIAKCARGRDPPVDIISTLRATAALSEGDLVARLGENFARGHKEASGGIVGKEEFDELMEILGVGDRRSGKTRDNAEAQWEGAKRESPKKRKVIDEGQKNTLAGYFGKATKMKSETKTVKTEAVT